MTPLPASVEQQIINTMALLAVTKIDDGWNLKGANFESVCKRHADDVKTWSFIDGNESMSFAFSEMRWDSGEVLNPGAKHNEGELKRFDAGVSIMYDLGAGLSVEIIQDNYQWQKVAHIKSLQSLGAIPPKATYLEIVFDIETSVHVPNRIITDTNKISDNSFLHPVKVWDANDNAGVAVGEIKDGKLIKRIPVEWLISASYPVHTDATITYGAENVFNAATTYAISVAALDSTHFVVTYQDVGNSNHGTAIIGVVSGTTISSYGAENVFNAATTNDISVAALDSTHFVVTYQDEGNSNHGTAIVGVVSGTTISSYGAENVFNAAWTTTTSVAVLDSTHFVVAYQDAGNSDHGTAIVGVVSGTTISSYGAENVFNAATTYTISAATLDSTHFVVAYRDGGNSDNGTAIVGVVSGTTISSYGAENVFNAAATYNLIVAALDATNFVVAYRGTSNYGAARIGVVSGTTISSYGAENVFNAATTYNFAATSLDSTHFVVAYRDNGNSDHGTAIVGSIPSGIARGKVNRGLTTTGVINGGLIS